MANRQDGTVSRIDPDTDAVTAIVPVGRTRSAIAVGARRRMGGRRRDGKVSRIDPRRAGRRHDRRRQQPDALAVAEGSVWTAAVASPASHRGGTLRVE